MPRHTPAWTLPRPRFAPVPPMKIAVLGAGPLAAFAASCFAARGHDVLCPGARDRDTVALLVERVCRPDMHPGLDAPPLRPITHGRLRLGPAQAVEACPERVVFVAVGSPPRLPGRDTESSTDHQIPRNRG